MQLCFACSQLGYCRRLKALLISGDELADPEFLRGLRASAYTKAKEPREWLDYAADLYRDYRGWISDASGNEVLLDLEPLERAPREWWRDFCCRPCPAHIKPRVRIESRERVRVLGPILRASFPEEAKRWGARRAANDNRAKPSAANDVPHRRRPARAPPRGRAA